MQPPARFYSLDALRGIAAFAVVFWHWQHFFFDGVTSAADFRAEAQPFYSWLLPLYSQGWRAVDLFFTLSGFVFFWLYADRIAAARIPASRFALLRFSRLYPLHLITLLAVAAEQAWYSRDIPTGFVYPHNDAYHFVLNLLLIPSIGLEKGDSFNGPIWSISVEVVLYALFFALCRRVRPRLPLLLLLALLGFLVLKPIYQPLGRGVGAFFMGGAAHALYQRLITSRQPIVLGRALLLGTATAWLVTLWMTYRDVSLATVPGLWRAGAYFAPMLLFPCTVLALAWAETRRGTLGRRLSWLGDLSYSSYLWHFPLQLACVLLMPALGIGRDFFTSGLALAEFILALIAVSWASHRWLEMPAQRVLRQFAEGALQSTAGGQAMAGSAGGTEASSDRV